MAISDQVRAPQGPADKKAKAWYALPGGEVAAKLGVDLGSGLSAAKAAARLRRDGPNALPGSSRRQLCAGRLNFSMMAVKGAVIDILQAAREDHDSVVEPPRDLVRIPSRGGIDAYGPVLESMAAWLGEHGLACRRLAGAGGATVALTCEVHGGSPAPGMPWMPAWTPLRSATRRHGPAPGVRAYRRRWLHGRGSSDSEPGAAIFAHIAARLQDGAGGFGGSVVMLFDVDEHTGGFGGAKAYFEDAGAARGVDSMCQEVVTRSETR